MRYTPDQSEAAKWTQKCLVDLKGRQCFCGNVKQSGMSFCRRCFWRLPQDMRRALYQKIGDGYEFAYKEACQFLADTRSKTA